MILNDFKYDIDKMVMDNQNQKIIKIDETLKMMIEKFPSSKKAVLRSIETDLQFLIFIEWINLLNQKKNLIKIKNVILMQTIQEIIKILKWAHWLDQREPFVNLNIVKIYW